MNERVAALRDRALRARRAPDPEHNALRKESFDATEGEPAVIREAKAFAHYCRRRTLVIGDRDLIVGSLSCWTYDDETPVKPQIFGRQSFRSPWPVPDEVERFYREGILGPAGNHTTMDYDFVLAEGFAGLVERINRRLATLDQSDPDYVEKSDFLAALAIVAEGYIDYCRRYADHAADHAAKCADPIRRVELKTIARTCRRVRAEPPRGFREACQSAWFCFFFLPDAPGRVDQYLYPFYRADRASGKIDEDEARELLSCLWIKYFEQWGAENAVSAIQHLTLGGMKPDGSDASNDLTLLCLDVTEDLRLNRPQVGLRWNRNTPPALLRRAVAVLRTNAGNPDFCNDEQIVPALVRSGVAVEDARDFSLSGCHEVVVTGKSNMGSVEGFLNLPKTLRIALGLEPQLAPGADLTGVDTFEKLMDALAGAVEVVATAAHEISVLRDRREAERPGGNIHASLVVNDCIENARGYTQGGARYNLCNWNVIGVANLADSLLAIRKLVFEDREATLPQLADFLRENWQAHESLRQRIVNLFPHYGNDDDEADRVAARIIEMVTTAMQRRTPYRGGQYVLGTLAGGENMHIEFGRVTGATPDGRTAGTPLADSIGAAQGRDRHGVTALLNSVAKLPHALLPTATTLNVKLDPKMIAGDAGVEKIAALIEGHFLSGGQQCQFNLVNREMLLEAKAAPERFGNLMVRVAGYSAPFTSLWEDLQDEIIARTEHAC